SPHSTRASSTAWPLITTTPTPAPTQAGSGHDSSGGSRGLTRSVRQRPAGSSGVRQRDGQAIPAGVAGSSGSTRCRTPSRRAEVEYPGLAAGKSAPRPFPEGASMSDLCRWCDQPTAQDGHGNWVHTTREYTCRDRWYVHLSTTAAPLPDTRWV